MSRPKKEREVRKKLGQLHADDDAQINIAWSCPPAVSVAIQTLLNTARKAIYSTGGRAAKAYAITIDKST